MGEMSDPKNNSPEIFFTSIVFHLFHRCACKEVNSPDYTPLYSHDEFYTRMHMESSPLDGHTTLNTPVLVRSPKLKAHSHSSFPVEAVIPGGKLSANGNQESVDV